MALKITGKVISLLASEIYEKNFEALHKKERADFEKQRSSLKLTKEEEKFCKDLEVRVNDYNTLVRSYGRSYNYLNTDITKELLNRKKDSVKRKESKYPTQNQLEKDITLAMLDAGSVEELVNKIKEKYKI